MCHLVALRGASLAAAATGGLLRVMGRDGKHTAMQPTAVVVDGGLFEHYAAFRGCAGPVLLPCLPHARRVLWRRNLLEIRRRGRIR